MLCSPALRTAQPGTEERERERERDGRRARPLLHSSPRTHRIASSGISTTAGAHSSRCAPRRERLN